jgi:tRNA (uracil-5-)-methyltransferase
MTCKHFGACASCKLYEMSYDEQLSMKTAQIKADFEPFFDGDIEVFSSKPERFRSRAEFSVFHHDDESFSYAMRGFANERVFLDSCWIVDEFIALSMSALKVKISGNQTLKRRLFGVEFLSNGAGEILATLIYHKKLDMHWIEAAAELSGETGIKLIGRSRGQRLTLDNDFITARFEVDGKTYALRQVEGAFSQPNGGVNAKMLGWARSKLTGVGGDLIELYCGSGNFTVVNAGLFEKVFATEIASSLIDLAKTNAAGNGVENITFARLSASDTAQALDGVREFNRLRGVNLHDFNFSTIFVDPPRAGMDEESCKLAQKFDNILYISCSPQSLQRDLQTLTQTHCVESFALFDQFAYTHHIECGVFLRRK